MTKKKSRPIDETLQNLRDKIRKRIVREELENAWTHEVTDALLTSLGVDATTLQRSWIQPLMAAGATLDEALTCIAQSQFRPN